MKRFEEGGHGIEIKTEQESGVWSADVWVYPTSARSALGLTDATKLTDFDSEPSAEAAGLKWARERIRLKAEGRP